MPRISTLLPAALLLFGPAARAGGTLDFEGLTTTAAPVPSGYGGLTWTNFFALDSDYFRDPDGSPGVPGGYFNGVTSGTSLAFDPSGASASFGSATPFDLGTADLTAVWRDGLRVEVEGFLGGVEAFDRVVTLDATAPTAVDFGGVGVDLVTFTPTGGTHHDGYDNGDGTNFTLDDLAIAPASSAPGVIPAAVPEPASAVIAALGGLLALAFARLRRDRRAGVAIGVAALAVLAAPPAHAGIITETYEGKVTGVTGPAVYPVPLSDQYVTLDFLADVHGGDAASATIQFDESLLQPTGDPGYLSGIIGVGITISGGTFGLSGGGDAYVAVGPGGTVSISGYGLYSGEPFHQALPPNSGDFDVATYFSLFASPGGFSATINGFHPSFRYGNPAIFVAVGGNIPPLTTGFATVPEPASLVQALLGMGIAGAAWRRRRRRQR